MTLTAQMGRVDTQPLAAFTPQLNSSQLRSAVEKAIPPAACMHLLGGRRLTGMKATSSTCVRRLIACVSVAFCVAALSTPVTAVEDDSKELTLITHNVWYGFTKKPEPRYREWRAWMSSQAPDVVCLQELNGYTPEKLAADAASWGHPHSALLKEDGFPTGITSRLPIEDVRRVREGFHHGLLRCRIAGIWLFVIHFHPSNYAHRITEAGLLADEIAALPALEGQLTPKIVLAGDFNGFSPIDKPTYDADPLLEPFFTRLDAKNPQARNLNNGRLDYGGVEAILAQGFVDIVADHRGDRPFVGTFPTPLVADEDHGTDRRLDYIFVSPNLKETVSRALILRDDTTEMLSDHIPVMATLRLPNR